MPLMSRRCGCGRRSIRFPFSPSAWESARYCCCQAWRWRSHMGNRWCSIISAALLYLCIFPSILGYMCLNRGIELIGANRAAPFIHLVPVFGSVLAIALLGERLQLFHAVGYALVLAGITLATRR